MQRKNFIIIIIYIYIYKNIKNEKYYKRKD